MLLSTKRMITMIVLGVGLFLTGSSIAQATDLLISEYVEGSSNNKYVEIYNGTSGPIDLSNYQIRLYSNGNSSPNVTNTLTGILAVGNTAVYSNSSAAVYAGTTINLGSMGFNGDDAIELFNTSTGLSVDIFGVLGCDPGTQWISTSNRTQNRTLRRNSSVTSGVTSSPSCTSSSADFTTLESEWTEYPTDNVADLGNHSIAGSNPIVDLGADQSICSGASITLDSGGDGNSFLWSTGESTSSITVSAAGNYSVTVTNANGSTTDDINVDFYPPAALAISNPSNICSGESIEICTSVLTDELFISEYIEGSGLIKCLEIYNGTGSSVDLGAFNYSIDITYNGGSSTISIPLTGVVANGATHVLCDDGAGQAFLNTANQITNSNLWNGDDAIVLSKNGVAMDIFGVINSDPGAQWSGGGNSTQNSTLRRNGSVTEGITTNPTGTGTGAFTTLATEWTQGALNDPSDLGSHTVTGDGTFTWSTGETTLCMSVAPTSTTDYIFSYTSAAGCATDISTTVSVSTLAVSVSSTSILCNGGTADITVTATGGASPYTGTGMFTVSAGTYDYTVTDADGCSITETIIVTEPASLVATATAPSILCNGDMVDITVSATGGTAPYVGTGLFNQGAGTYDYTITDANGCTATTSITLTEPTLMTAYSSCPAILCNGGTEQMAVFAFGGTTPYTGEDIYIVGAGTYNYTITDANGCTSSVTHVVTEPAVTVVASVSGSTTIDCNGGTSAITVTATGGATPYSGTGTFDVTAGTQTFTVTDADGCTSTQTITLTEPVALVASASGSIPCGGTTADVIVTATGGTAPYIGTGTFSETAGTYTYTITDANGCSTTVTHTVASPSAIVVSISSTGIDCNGGTSTVTVSVTGGLAPYTGTGTFSQSAGTTTYTVTDANGCSSTESITITEPSALVASASAAGSILCNGGSTDVTITATGGTAPYTGTGTFSQSAGTTTYTVTDANGCTSTVSITLTEPAALVASASVAGSILCNGGSTDVTVTATGGTAPYTGTGTFSQSAGTSTYTVTDANGCTSDVTITVTEPAAMIASASAAGSILCNGGSTDVIVTATGGTAPYSGTGTFSQSVGTTSYTVTDANGCTSTTSITLAEPAALTVSTSIFAPILCNGGTANVTITATGGTATYTGTGTFSQSAGTTTYTVTDANGCTSDVTITVTEPAALVASASAGTILCNGGTANVTITATGGTATYTGTGIFSQSAGTTTYTVTDANGCTSDVTITLSEPAPLVAAATVGPVNPFSGTADVTVTATGGTPSYSGTGVFTLSSGTYTLIVTDANGCASLVTVSFSGGLDGFIIYPNPAVSTGGQVFIKVDAELETDMTVRILNLSGQVIYTDFTHIDAGFNTKGIDVTGYTTGSYMIEVVTNRINKTQQLIVQ